MYENFSLQVSNLKCFADEPQGFESIKTVNLIIGRNNSGKSSLIDLVHQACLPAVDIPAAKWHRNKPAMVFSETSLSDEDIKKVFPENVSGGAISGSHYRYGSQFVGANIAVRLVKSNSAEFKSLHLTESQRQVSPSLDSQSEYLGRLVNLPNRNPFSGKEFRRLGAERDIGPESDSQTLEIQGNGAGATNMIQHFINKSHLPSELIEETLLDALNKVFGSDAKFEDIVCQHHSNNAWEIYLQEAEKGRIPLSQSGSGLKTIILALCFIHLLPVIVKKPLHDFVFAFEELENNLHPALQRRLLSYLVDQARANSFPLFLTTHSSVAIDMFSKQKDAQILHVTHNGEQGFCRTVSAYIDNQGVLDDLDVRASDLLQSNGVIWVEGPSDRIYVNRWVELWSDGQLVEGTHYQCIFYGGRLLAHLSASAPDETDDGVAILSVNRNAALIIDSDKRNKQTPINKTKQRVVSEIEGGGGFAWVTQGREIENYIPVEAISEAIASGVKFEPQDDKYESFFDYLDRQLPGKGKEYSQKKPLLAEQLVVHMTRENIKSASGLASKLDQLCDAIRKWNSM